MITVSIAINGEVIFARSATNMEKRDKKGKCQYRTDCNHIVEHDPEDGAVLLAHKLLDLIQEDGAKQKERLYKNMIKLLKLIDEVEKDDTSRSRKNTAVKQRKRNIN